MKARTKVEALEQWRALTLEQKRLFVEPWLQSKQNPDDKRDLIDFAVDVLQGAKP